MLGREGTSAADESAVTPPTRQATNTTINERMPIP
jgi:hypothetical protein